MTTITEAEKVVHERLGAGHGVVKIGRYWLVGRTDDTDKGWRLLAQAGSLDKAVREALAQSQLEKVPPLPADVVARLRAIVSDRRAARGA